MSNNQLIIADDPGPPIDDVLETWLERVQDGAQPVAAASALGFPVQALKNALQARTGAALAIMSAAALEGAEKLQAEALAIADATDEAGWIEHPEQVDPETGEVLAPAGRSRDTKRDALRIRTRLAIAESRMRLVARMAGSASASGGGGVQNPDTERSFSQTGLNSEIVSMLTNALQQADMARRRDSAVDATPVRDPESAR